MYKIYSKPNCIWCDRAKELLVARSEIFMEYKLASVPEKEDPAAPKNLRYITREHLLAQFPDAKTVPIVTLVTVDGDQYIGGFEDLKNFLDKS